MLVTDNFFTNIQLAKRLREKKIYLLGTVKKTSKGLPKDFVNEGVSTGMTKYIFNKNFTLVKYQPKPSKSVLLLSTAHHNIESCEIISRVLKRPISKPTVVHEYNAGKSGVDIFDKITAAHSCQFTTRRYSIRKFIQYQINRLRWPMKVFQRTMDTASMNACVLWAERNEFSSPHDRNIFRHRFLVTLAEELMKPQLHKSMQTSTYWLTGYHRKIFALEDEMHLKNTPKEKRAATFAEPSTTNPLAPCDVCTEITGRPDAQSRIRVVCYDCGKYLCMKHRERKNYKYFCQKCLKKRH
jgi:hypothetical protein